jgi:hypothetical protein
MSTSSLIFLVIRVLHVLLAAAWIGASVFAVLFLDRLLTQTDRGSSVAVLTTLGRSGFNAFMASVGGLTVLTGLWLYWRFTGHFDPALSASMGARVFGAGGLSGIVALIVGGSVIGRTFKKMTALASRAASLPDGAERTTLLSQIDGARARMHATGWIVVVLQIIALSTMAIGHYV